MNPMAGIETLFFEPRCLEKYRCHFAIEEVSPRQLREKMDEVTRNYERVNRFFNAVNVENMKKIGPSFDKYMEKARGLHEEFGELLKEHGAKILGCDEQCIEDCLDTSYVTYWEIPMCVKNCQCTHGVISIDRGLGISEEEESSIFRGDSTLTKDLTTSTSSSVSILDRINPFKKTTVHSDKQEEEDIFTPTIRRKREKREFNLPELMKYSDYDKKAWSFFKKYQDDI